MSRAAVPAPFPGTASPPGASRLPREEMAPKALTKSERSSPAGERPSCASRGGLSALLRNLAVLWHRAPAEDVTVRVFGTSPQGHEPLDMYKIVNA